MSGVSMLFFGFGLGIRHALDPDHVVVVSALVQREPGPLRAAKIAALWGLGHTVAFLALGLLVVIAGVKIPTELEQLAECLVALMLIGFGLWHLVRSRTSNHAANPSRPIAIGLVHGLAGSAGTALVAAATIHSRPLATLYLVLVALGTVLGMVSLTMLMSRPILWTMRHEGRLARGVTVTSALLSIALGASIFIRMQLFPLAN